ncbi:RNA-binding KH domain-containing protein RCF3 [Mercurialis annua]|uniref:RNA-binding KH domain-containing protein RCF3 n=1 Tax=Mercurialis annua TaxID=3986 RepID=UPI00215E743D|nr:RNA-binding KH domain-containing protein RCF3 [Mercurialis annua]XP_050226500.1 RNA-binding KH domain-containing protein RCF3 [Mercurialis annua]XP_055961540.1 RNA-binding KH domain-containing protein RCF3 [Mercurialis annua]
MAGHRNSYGKRSHSSLSDYDNNGSSKRRHSSGGGGGDDRESFAIDSKDTVYRYLCPLKKIGSIIGRGGEIVKQLRIDTKSKIRIGETVPNCDDRVVTIYSASDETNLYEDTENYICPSQDALFRVHDRVIAEDMHSDDESDDGHQVVARLIVPSDQIGCIIGKGGQIVQNIRSETGAQIRILKDEHVPPCALSTDELVQISGEIAVVKKALYQIATRLHENPSRTQHLLFSAIPSAYAATGSLMGPTGAPIVGIAPLMSPYGGYKSDTGDWSRSLYSAPRDELSSKDFSLRMVCPTANIGGVIGKGGTIINQIRQESGAGIKVDSSTAGDDCLITVSAKEFFDDQFSPTIEAALRLQPRCSEKIERDSGLISFTTRLLVPTSRIGCLLGKGGVIINDMRKLTKANIRILGKENLPKVASEDDEMVQISGDLDVAKEALTHISRRLRANVFDRESAVSTFLPVLPYLPVPTDSGDSLNYDSRDSKRHGRGHTYSSGYGSSDYTPSDNYGTYGSSQMGSSGGPYGAYGSYSSGRSSSSGLSSQNPGSRRKSYY